MANLKTTDKKLLEKLLEMESGYVLNFSDRTMEEFFKDNFGINIYDEKYNYYTGSKANRMRSFWQQESNLLVSEVIICLIDYIENEILIDNLKEADYSKKLIEKAKKIAVKLKDGNNISSNQDEISFLKEDFDDIDSKIKNLEQEILPAIEQRVEEIEKCLKTKIYLGAVFLVGSTLEGILFDLAKKNANKFCSAKSAPKSKGITIPMDQWKLNSLIDVAFELGYLNLNTKKFSHDLKDFRNFMHPREQVKYAFNPDEHTAKICFQVLKSAIDDIF